MTMMIMVMIMRISAEETTKNRGKGLQGDRQVQEAEFVPQT